MHLTNYAINKENPNFIFNNDANKMDVGHKRSIKSVFGKLEEEGHNI
jgi:tubulin polyglutamylase TTLL6/13